MASPQHPVPFVESPWDLHAETYVLFLNLKTLPPGTYDPLEASWSDASNGTFTGGLGAIMIVRYTSTPVGPYDELALIPGSFTVPQPTSTNLNTGIKIPKSALRISRIYVSQRTTAYNGRLNWNIPKHLARFSFSSPPTPSGTPPPSFLSVKVYAPGSSEGDGVAPFFSVNLRPWKYVPAIPVNLKYLPFKMWHAQPPIPTPSGFLRAAEQEIADKREGRTVGEYEVSAKNEVAVMPGTESWRAFDADGTVKRARGCWVEVVRSETAGEEEGKYFPQELRPWSVGGWCEEAVLKIGKGVEWKL
ncbi:hypothetical protein BU23DRAFT_480788 [Bimuria novae-zelandiae CBS 107.79]|uniref:Uncharacterized protein n=1 Tax=Bimuria novae-zelandiae CBS 107.79 TaxID=1447943 RepID=A0A6A5USV8_9PLEO|nr:hypothetical protein BU23DRAFT_480788 [Bimuria novae-zelandiae CBS 107.79]